MRSHRYLVTLVIGIGVFSVNVMLLRLKGRLVAASTNDEVLVVQEEELPFGIMGHNVTLHHPEGLSIKTIQALKRNASILLEGFLGGKVSRGGRYSPSGGVLPQDDHKLYPDCRTWVQIDNNTCLGDGKAEPLFSWQRRSPHAILLGTMKGGTHALLEYLWDHPQVSRPAGQGYELHFFDGKYFQRNASGIPQQANQLAYANRVQNMYPDFFQHPNNGSIAIHDSPRYLLWSDRIPSAILCVTPWAKLLAVLRDPVERAVSHYRFQHDGT